MLEIWPEELIDENIISPLQVQIFRGVDFAPWKILRKICSTIRISDIQKMTSRRWIKQMKGRHHGAFESLPAKEEKSRRQMQRLSG